MIVERVFAVKHYAAMISFRGVGGLGMWGVV